MFGLTRRAQDTKTIRELELKQFCQLQVFFKLPIQLQVHVMTDEHPVTIDALQSDTVGRLKVSRSARLSCLSL